MRQILLLVTALSVFATAEAAAQPRADVAVGASVASREGTSGLSPGAGMTMGFGRGSVVPSVEASWTRRDGHNDWRSLAGVRLRLVRAGAATLSTHALAGALWRSGQGGVGTLAGVALDWRPAGRAAVRAQADVTWDSADGRRATGARGSLWLVLR